MIKKSPLVKALMQVLSEYKANTHNLEMRNCAICNLYRKYYGYDCGNCPFAQVFHRCGSRMCAPVNCKVHASTKRSKAYNQRLLAVQEFYVKVLSRVRRMTVSELNTRGAFDFMIKIDQEVSQKYNLERYRR